MEGQHREPKATEGSWRSPSIEHARLRRDARWCDRLSPRRVASDGGADDGDEPRSLGRAHRGRRGPVRVITDRELLAAAGPGAEDRDAAAIAIDPVTVTIDELLTRAVQVMLEQGVSHLLVVNDAQRALGVVSALDVAGVLAWGRA